MKILKQFALVALLVSGQSLFGDVSHKGYDVDFYNYNGSRGVFIRYGGYILSSSDITQDNAILDLIVSKGNKDVETNRLIGIILDLSLKIHKIQGKIGYIYRLTDGTAPAIDVLRGKVKRLEAKKRAVEKAIKEHLMNPCERIKQAPCVCAPVA